jgi:hypothetical protein
MYMYTKFTCIHIYLLMCVYYISVFVHMFEHICTIYLYSHRRNNSNEYGMTEEERTLGSGAGDNYLDKKRGQTPGRGVPDPATGAKLSPHVFLLVISMYFLGKIYIYVYI